MPMLVQDGLEKHAALTPGKTALVCGGRRLSYAELDAMANRLANALIAGGVRRGDRVVVYLKNSVEAVAAIFGILKASAAFVAVNRAVKLEKLAYILGNAEAAALIADARIARDGTLEGLRSRYLPPTVMLADGADLGAGCPATRPRREAIDLDLACLVYTSGSTGEPKGVMSDHSNVAFAAGSIISYLNNTADDVVIGVLPLSFDYGLYQLLMTTMFGGTLVLEPGFVFPAEILARIAEERVTGFPGVPTIFAALLAMDLDGFDLSSLRYITNTAAALPPSHIEALRRKFPGVTIYSMYGLTETKRTLYLPPEQLDARPDSVGIAIPGTEVWVEGPDGARLGPDEIGELVVRGRHVMRGYWRDPAETARRFRPGIIPGERLCYTGDLFRMDRDGYFYFAGRQDDIIKTRGEKVSPKEVENVLHGLDGVYAAAVVGVPDPLLGQAVKAVIVADRSRVTQSRVLAHCRAHLEDFMVPKLVEFRDELPVSPSGKVVKRDLAQCAESRG
jgi:long-chain acyl-CoA synthetase